MPLLPWSKRFFDVTTEYDLDTGWPKRRRALATLPRQSGKSVALASWLIDLHRRKPGAYTAYVAQSRQAAANRLRGIATMLHDSGLDPGAKLTMGVGNERLRLFGGEVQVHSPTADAVHGESLDGAVLDEVFSVKEHIMQALGPAMAARPAAQLMMISTQGTLESHLLNRLCDIGREDPDGAMAYAEYALPEDVHPFSWEHYPVYHPGLGHTIRLEHLQDEAKLMTVADYTRAYANRLVATTTPLIPEDVWAGQAAHPAPGQQPVLAVERTAWGASIAAAYATDVGYHGDLVDYQEGADWDWVWPRLTELADRLDVRSVVYDSSGPMAAAEPRMKAWAEEQGIPLVVRTARQRARGEVWTMGQVIDHTVTHNDLPALTEAVQLAQTETLGDLWRIQRRRALGDTSPAVAWCLAVYAAYEADELAPTPGIVW